MQDKSSGPVSFPCFSCGALFKTSSCHIFSHACLYKLTLGVCSLRPVTALFLRFCRLLSVPAGPRLCPAMVTPAETVVSSTAKELEAKQQPQEKDPPAPRGEWTGTQTRAERAVHLQCTTSRVLAIVNKLRACLHFSAVATHAAAHSEKARQTAQILSNFPFADCLLCVPRVLLHQTTQAPTKVCLLSANPNE